MGRAPRHRHGHPSSTRLRRGRLPPVDAIAIALAHGAEFDFIHASTPRQGEGAPTKSTNAARNPAIGRTHRQLFAPTRAALGAVARPCVIENVPGSEVGKDIRLCGEQFGLGVIMHRYFELGAWTAPAPAHRSHRGRVRGWRHGAYYDGLYVAAYGRGGGKATVDEIRATKGIDWTAITSGARPFPRPVIGTAALAALTLRKAA